MTTPLKDSLISNGLNRPATAWRAGKGLKDLKPKTTDGPATAKTRAGTGFKDTTTTRHRRVMRRARSAHVARHGYPSAGPYRSPRRRSVTTRAHPQRPGATLGPEAARDLRLPGDVLGRPPNPPPRPGQNPGIHHPGDIAVSRAVQEARTSPATANPSSKTLQTPKSARSFNLMCSKHVPRFPPPLLPPHPSLRHPPCIKVIPMRGENALVSRFNDMRETQGGRTR